MNVSLDFDKTYTLDPLAWSAAVAALRKAGHSVYLVSMRFPPPSDEAAEVRQALDGKVDGFFFTSRRAKADFMRENFPAIRIDVWIDDSPYWILNGG